jgi:hypothetical protein
MARIARTPWSRLTPVFAGVLVATGLALSAAAATARTSSPVPTCKWAPKSLIDKDLKVSVKAPKASFTVQYAPVLTCSYVETKSDFQAKGKPIVSIGFRESQHFIPPSAFTPVKGLGSCLARSCPKPHKPAWIDVTHATTGTAPYAMTYVSGVTLFVEDGLNCVTITVQNPNDALPVKDETAQVEKLARSLLPRFKYS